MSTWNNLKPGERRKEKEPGILIVKRSHRPFTKANTSESPIIVLRHWNHGRVPELLSKGFGNIGRGRESGETFPC